MTSKLIGSQTEYNKLTKVILGRLDNGNKFPDNDLGMLLAIAADEGLHDREGRLDITESKKLVPEITSAMVEETSLELQQLNEFFEKEDVEVVRPEPVPENQEVHTKSFTTTQFPVYCPRDVIFNFRDLIVISPNAYQSRIHEGQYYASIINDEQLAGRLVVYAPRPQHLEEDFNFSADAKYILNSDEPIFEAANTLIDGEHNAIYYQISNSGNIAGYKWLKQIISYLYPEVTVYPLKDIYNGTHLDTTIAILNYDTVSINPERIPDITLLPEPLKNRKVISPDILDARNESALSSKWIGMNSLSINPNLLIVDANQVRYIEQLENAGFKVFPHKLSYSDILEGGHHCTSSDLNRIENY